MEKKTQKKSNSNNESVKSPYDFKTVGFDKVPLDARIVLLLDLRGELTKIYIGGLKVVARDLTKKNDGTILSFKEGFNASNDGFKDMIRQKNDEVFGEHKPLFNVMDIVENRNGKMRFIAALKVGENKKIVYMYVDPNNALSQIGECSESSMTSWMEK